MKSSRRTRITVNIRCQFPTFDGPTGNDFNDLFVQAGKRDGARQLKADGKPPAMPGNLFDSALLKLSLLITPPASRFEKTGV
ncbi:hypothetical protein [Pantoea stewartii]|uniref:hypothetical protein n=1 Tax=Pantoea stewartii TaxID=66269 RepID=UPI0025A10EB3|nr:hypothetical protein [Pantoea stewartii]